MIRTAVACGLTSALTILAGTGTGLARTSDSYVHAPLGESVQFAASDLLCVNEPAYDAGRFHTAGVSCSSYAKTYRGRQFWFTPVKVAITAPATSGGRILFTLKRRARLGGHNRGDRPRSRRRL
ncbi:MAG TPA: hypothetical protein VGM80_12870 [Gaiellaceae bacterium]